MAKRYIRINWQNAPSVATPRNAENLNIMDKGIDDLDLYKVDIDAIANNLVTTEAGLVLDARQGKVLDGKVNELTNNLADIKPVKSDVATISWGGYTKARSIVIINVSLTTTAAISIGEAIVTDLPGSVSNAPVRIVNVSTGLYFDGYLSGGSIRSSTSIPSGALLSFACSYLSV